MLEIPGYRYDEATNRYFKYTPREKEQEREKQKVERRREKQAKRQSSRAAKHGDPYENGQNGHRVEKTTYASVAQLPRRTQAVAVAGSYDAVTSANARDTLMARQHLRHSILLSSIATLRLTGTEEPDLTVADSLRVFTFDDVDPSLVHFGTSSGMVGHGYLTKENASKELGHNVSSWRPDAFLTSAVTSVNACQDNLLYTSFGPNPQASYVKPYGAQITLCPRKTSLWSSSLSPERIALGCDKKIMVSQGSDPSRAEMGSYSTGSAVFTIHQHENEILAATRSGHLRALDVRACERKDDGVHPEILLRMPGPITHIRRPSENFILLALMNGEISMYDRRWLSSSSPPSPLLRFAGHINTHSVNLGLSVWEDKLLAAAGEDCRIRLWSLKTGQLVCASRRITENGPQLDTLLGKVFEEAPRAIEFESHGAGGPGAVKLWVANGAVLERYTVA